MATNATLALSLIVAVAGAILVILGFAGRRNGQSGQGRGGLFPGRGQLPLLLVLHEPSADQRDILWKSALAALRANAEYSIGRRGDSLPMGDEQNGLAPVKAGAKIM